MRTGMLRFIRIELKTIFFSFQVVGTLNNLK